MADFPRTKPPRRWTLPRIPQAMISVGLTGGVQTRATGAIGRVWTETWGPLRATAPAAQALFAFVENALHQGTVFNIIHYSLPGSGIPAHGAHGGTPLVDGASQTGASLDTDGWDNYVAGVVKAGDVFRIDGLNQLFRATADADSDGSGGATLSVSPPIIAGGSPADNAALTVTSAKIRAVIESVSGLPESDFAGWLDGLSVTFREAV